MLSIPWPLLLAGALALIVVVLIARANGRRAEQLRRDRDTAIDAGKRAYAQGHEDGLNDQRRRIDGELVQVSTAYRQGYVEGQAEGREATAGRRNGRKPTSAA